MERIPLDVYLSRRSNEKDARKSLEKAIESYNNQDEKYQITLRVSEGEVEEGESIVEFMDEIGVARFVVLLLTKSYFESPNCMHELLLIHHYQDSNQRLFPLSIKADDSLNDSHLGTMITALEDDKKRRKLIELQEPLFSRQGITDKKEIYPLITKKLDQVDEQILKPLRENNVPVCEKIDDLLALVIKAADSALEAEERELTSLLQREVSMNLKSLESDQRKYLEREINERDAKIEELAEKLIDLDVYEAMLIVQRWVESQSKSQVQLGYQEWRRFLKPCEAIAGWLLLCSIDNTWWIHNKTRLLSIESDKVNCQQVDIGEPAFAEVIIAKSLKEQAVFGLNRYSELIPGRLEESFAGYDNVIATENNQESIEQGFVLDAGDEAVVESLLTPIAYDLLRQPDEFRKDRKSLIDNIVRVVGGLRKNAFYIVTQSYYQSISTIKIPDTGLSILDTLNSRLQNKRGRLIFISYGNEQREDGSQACDKDTELDLLTIMADILAIDRKQIKKLTPARRVM